MADSTSRWAEALRELSDAWRRCRRRRIPRLPADPARRVLRARGNDEDARRRRGSISIAGGFAAGRRFLGARDAAHEAFVRCLWALDRQLANARHYPAISWLDSYSEYVDESRTGGRSARAANGSISAADHDLLQQEGKLQQVVKLVGPDVLPTRSGSSWRRARCSRTPSSSRAATTRSHVLRPEKQIKMLRSSRLLHPRARGHQEGREHPSDQEAEVFSDILRHEVLGSGEELEKIDASGRSSARRWSA